MSGLDRLLEKQKEELEAINVKLQLWNQYQSDYKCLKKLINEMKDKVRHPYRIPIAGTSLAFMDGHIIHTNELTVLLGDNYFALRSAKQANEIIDRRLDNIKENLSKTQEAKRKTEDWFNASQKHKQETEEFVEIIETM